jgi:hypothetical protein
MVAMSAATAVSVPNGLKIAKSPVLAVPRRDERVCRAARLPGVAAGEIDRAVERVFNSSVGHDPRLLSPSGG